MAAAIAKNLMKISKLSEITGVARDAIHYYIREGLLPKPVKTKKNMAYYDHTYIKRLRFIKELQNKRFLPLQVIKQILTESEGNIGADEIKTILELDGKLFKNMKSRPDLKPLTFNELVDRFGLPGEEIKKLIELGIISPENNSGDEVFGEDCIRIVEIWSKIRQIGFTEKLGFSVDLLQIYQDLIEVLVKKEAQIFATRLTGNVDSEESVKMTEAAIHLTNNFIGLLRKRTILKLVRDYGMQSS